MANILPNHLSGRKVTNSAPLPPPRRAELKKSRRRGQNGGGAARPAGATVQGVDRPPIGPKFDKGVVDTEILVT